MLRLRSIGLLLAAVFSLTTARAAQVLTGEYKLPASFDAEVTTELETEEWARVWRPADDGHYPLVIFLHGNHGTCGHFDAGLGVRIDDNIDYTFDGTCPDGYVVTPNHRGYDYMAADLASHGYIVVSINANRGVTAAPGDFDDEGLNLRRGRLVLRHMEYLSQWNASGGAPDSLGFQLTGQIDFRHVGLMGHSRGGEGVRAAVAQYKDKNSPWPGRIGPVKFEAMFEIGPVDGQTSRVLDNTGMAWNVLLPGCDGDVYDLEGLRPYDRGIANTGEKKKLNKSTFEVFGANHNFYNTEWQLSDSGDCTGQTALFPQLKGSRPQRATAHDTLIPFFLAHLGSHKKPLKARIFDPSYPLPTKLASITAYDRGFSPAPREQENFVVDNFDKQTGTSSEGVANQSSGLSQYFHGQGSEDDDPVQRAALVAWTSNGGFLEVNATAAGSAADISDYPALEFRVALRCFAQTCTNDPDPSGDVDFSIALADSAGNLSQQVAVKSVAAVHRPAGTAGVDNVIFQTLRVPVSSFTGFDPANFHGVRFTFDKTKSASVYFANVRFTKTAAGTGGLSSFAPAQARTLVKPPAKADTNRIALDRAAAGVEVALSSSRRFPIGDALPVLTIGERRFTLSRLTRDGRIVFSVAARDFAGLRDGEAVTLRIGGAPAWSFGDLRK
ncbi:MAG TPA: hypothetical protein VG889_08270 [Rhizomicrobium sp.]|nr:hypothetical protein [Rhizomicrobium sp.]